MLLRRRLPKVHQNLLPKRLLQGRSVLTCLGARMIYLGLAHALTGAASCAAAGKRRRIIRQFEGATPTEARDRIVRFVTNRTDDPAKAEHVADRVVARLDARGVLAPEPV